jgi:hypothetical protein
MVLQTEYAAPRHGRAVYVIDEKDVYDVSGARVDVDPQSAVATSETSFRFTRMLAKQDVQPSEEILRSLGDAMQGDQPGSIADSSVPAGYTYLGQFIAHEVTQNKTAFTDVRNIKHLIEGVSPRVDLGSVYGTESIDDHNIGPPFLLPVGDTLPDANGVRYARDLPRANDGKALIPELRNDDNVTLAQFHVALLRFHNAVAQLFYRRGLAHGFKDVANTVIEHFQSVVLHDYLSRLVDPEIYSDVCDHGAACFGPNEDDPRSPPAMPVEFALAAFRFGHSMVRAVYGTWNRYNAPDVAQLFQKTHNNGTITTHLDATWILDWRNFFEVPAPADPALSEVIYARPIDTRIAIPLKQLPPRILMSPEPSNNLPIRTLLFGRALALPSGQNAADQINRCLLNANRACPPIRVLTADKIVADEDDRVKQILSTEDLLNNTPLWFYILKEAQVQGNGNRLGQLGSRIVMEVLSTLIRCSNPSILRPGWKPSLPRHQSDRFSMVDLLAFAGGLDPYEDMAQSGEGG